MQISHRSGGSCAISPAGVMGHESRSLLTSEPHQYKDTMLLHRHAQRRKHSRARTRTCTFQHKRETYSWVVAQPTHTRTSTHINTHWHIHTQTHMHTRTHVHTHTHTHTHIHTHTHTHTYIQSHTHTHTRTPGNAKLRPTFLTN